MHTYISKASCISPQKTFDDDFFSLKPQPTSTNILHLIEPDFSKVLDAKQLRRMSRIVKAGAAAALNCLTNETAEPDAIITGSAYGCMEDSEFFLKKIIMQDEQMLSPTPFIQSTHNTIGAQVALILKNHHYNNTFVHKGFSFEYALLDAMMILDDKEDATVLAGSADEITDLSFAVMQRFGLYKSNPVVTSALYNSDTRGSIAGEGAAFFLLSNNHSNNDYARLNAVEIFYNPSGYDEIVKRISTFLSNQKTNPNNLDLIILGENGDAEHDKNFKLLKGSFFIDNNTINYKHLCGEYPTSSSFALWLATNIIKQNKLPEAYSEYHSNKNFNKILIYNVYLKKYHSIMLLSK